MPPREIGRYILRTSRIDPRNMSTRLRIHGIEELGDLDDHLSSLANHELFALQSRQMLGHSWPRSADEVGDVLMAERYVQQGAARFLASKALTEFHQRSGYSFVQAKVQEIRAAEQEEIPLLQIVVMRLLEGGLASICGD